MNLEPTQILDGISRSLLGATMAFGTKDLSVEIENAGTVNVLLANNEIDIGEVITDDIKSMAQECLTNAQPQQANKFSLGSSTFTQHTNGKVSGMGKTKF
ncbi:hypothetical protein [Psychromonas sp. KJ10-2]|uniref:hypothetical protein n=1 Tax=Psychromonas sp. KJ10-2 TaxID=3391822 RepID=UPI0039B546D5